MRLICEVFLAALLIWLGWDKSFHAWTDQWRGIQPPPNTAAAPAQSTPTNSGSAGTGQTPRPAISYRPPPASTPSGQWMWDPAHRGPLDALPTKVGAAGNPTAPPSASYWIDGNGQRHYNNAQPPPSSPSP